MLHDPATPTDVNTRSRFVNVCIWQAVGVGRPLRGEKQPYPHPAATVQLRRPAFRELFKDAFEVCVVEEHTAEKLVFLHFDDAVAIADS